MGGTPSQHSCISSEAYDAALGHDERNLSWIVAGKEVNWKLDAFVSSDMSYPAKQDDRVIL